MALASEALNSARTFLNDTGKQIWTDTKLLPFLKEAYRDLLIQLWLNGIPVLREDTTIPITVLTGAVVITLPADLLEPIGLKERLLGSTSIEDYAPMSEKAFEPDTVQTTELRYWSWREEQIQLVGALTDRQVLLRYWKTLTIPTSAASVLGFLFAEAYLGPKTTAYAAASTGNSTLAEEADSKAEIRLDQVIRANTKGQQSLPTRRIPYRRARRTRIFGM
jgi:hypothetical protein